MRLKLAPTKGSAAGQCGSQIVIAGNRSKVWNPVAYIKADSDGKELNRVEGAPFIEESGASPDPLTDSNCRRISSGGLPDDR
jgi:hypothetical protein